MKKWEYNFTMTNEFPGAESGKLIQHTLTMLGKQGWELCGAYVSNGWIHEYFKRPLRTPKKKRKPIVYGK